MGEPMRSYGVAVARRLTPSVLLVGLLSVFSSAAAQAPGDPAVVGQWSSPFVTPIRAVHMVLARTGQVLMWDAFGDGHEAYVWAPASGQFTYVRSSSNVFCAA